MQCNDRLEEVRAINFPVTIVEHEVPSARVCMMADVSLHGAMLVVEEAASLPDDFMLLLSYRGVPKRQCQVIWRTRECVGVRFTDPVKINQAGSGSDAVG